MPTAETNRYNGWTNYETWNVALWLGNEQGSYHACQNLAQEAWDDAEPRLRRDGGILFTREETAATDLAGRLKEMVEEDNPLAEQASMFTDLLGGALSEVNWREIAQHYIEDLDKAEDEDDSEDEDED